MIFEIAHITIDPTRADAFEAAVAEAAPYFQNAQGCHAMSLERVIEDPAQYRLRVQWESVDHHMVMFRESDAFQRWRELAGPFFVKPPHVEHSTITSSYF
jgi:quinol monooxygenase YgiN